MTAPPPAVKPRRRRPRRTGVSLLAALSLIAAACGPAGANTTTTPTPDPSTPTTAAPTTATTAAPTTTTTEPPSPEDEVITAWDAYWHAWVATRASAEPERSQLDQVAEPEVVDGAMALFEQLGSTETELVTHPTVSSVQSDSATLEDCVVMSPSWAEVAGVRYQAELIRRGEGWVVAGLRASIDGCVPAEMATAAIADYEAFFDAVVVFWDPPDPEHPFIDQVTAEPQLSFVVGLLEEDATRGAALRGRPTTHPEVTQVLGPTRLMIFDCYEPDPDYGLYDIATGARLPDEAPVEEGERDLQSAVMVLEDGQWKLSDLQRQVTGTTCEFAPTDEGLPSV